MNYTISISGSYKEEFNKNRLSSNYNIVSCQAKGFNSLQTLTILAWHGLTTLYKPRRLVYNPRSKRIVNTSAYLCFLDFAHLTRLRNTRLGPSILNGGCLINQVNAQLVQWKFNTDNEMFPYCQLIGMGLILAKSKLCPNGHPIPNSLMPVGVGEC